MKNTFKLITLLGSLALSQQILPAQQFTQDKANAVTSYVSLDKSELSRAKEIPRQLVTEFESFFPIDSVLRFGYSGDATNAEIIVSGMIHSYSPSTKTNSWIEAKVLSRKVKVNIFKGQNTLTIPNLPVHKAIENLMDSRKGDEKETGVELTFRLFVNKQEVGSIKKLYNAHKEANE